MATPISIVIARAGSRVARPFRTSASGFSGLARAARGALLALTAAAAGGCGHPPAGSDRTNLGLLASGPRPAEVFAGNGDRSPGGRHPGKIPAEVLQDPAERMRFRERMRVQILQRTRYVSAADYQRVVRPGLARQLRAMGLPGEDADLILADVDGSRPVGPGAR